MTLHKVIRAQERVPTSHSGSLATEMSLIGQKTPKIILKISCSALSGDPTDVISATNHSKCYDIGNQPLFFRQMALVNLLGIKRGFLHHKVSHGPQNWPELAKKHPNHPQNITFRSTAGLGGQYEPTKKQFPSEL